jgi:hypothetical protein
MSVSYKMAKKIPKVKLQIYTPSISFYPAHNIFMFFHITFCHTLHERLFPEMPSGSHAGAVHASIAGLAQGQNRPGTVKRSCVINFLGICNVAKTQSKREQRE